MHDTIYEYSIIEVQKFTLLLSTRTRDGKIRTQTKMAQRAIDYARSKLGYHEDYPATIHSSKFSKHISPNVYRRGTIEEWIKRGLFKTDGSYLAGTASLQYVVDRPFYEVQSLRTLNTHYIKDDNLYTRLLNRLKKTQRNLVMTWKK